MRIQTVDYHTAGEPFRIATGGADPLSGNTILDKRRHALEHADDVRRLLVNEPRGHADMYGCFVKQSPKTTAPTSASSSSTVRATRPPGHGTIALVTGDRETAPADGGARDARRGRLPLRPPGDGRAR